MFKFISFGSGSSGNCYYLYTDHGGLLIDSGIGIRMVKKYFSQYGLPLSEIKAILVTHDHADHVKSVGSLSNQLCLPVYATKEVHRGIDNNYVVRNKVPNPMRQYVTVGEEFQIDDFVITAVRVPHDSMDNVGYLIKYGDVSFGLVTDAGHITEGITQIISKSNYLVLESNHEVEKLMAGKYPEHLKRRILSPNGHLSNEECGRALRDYATPALKSVWLCHLSYDNNDPELALHTVGGILRDSGIVPGKDFTVEVLKRTTPTGFFDLL